MTTKAATQPEPKVRTFHQHGATEIRLTLLTQQEQDEACSCTVGKGPNPEEHPAVKACPTCKGDGVVKALKGHRLDLHVVDAESVVKAARGIENRHEASELVAAIVAVLDLAEEIAEDCDDGTLFTFTAENVADVLAGKTIGEMPKTE